MWALKVAYYRAYQKVMKVMLYFLDWSEPQLLTGPGSIRKLPSVIKEKGIGKVMVVTDKGLMTVFLRSLTRQESATLFMTAFSLTPQSKTLRKQEKCSFQTAVRL